MKYYQFSSIDLSLELVLLSSCLSDICLCLPVGYLLLTRQLSSWLQFVNVTEVDTEKGAYCV